MELGKVRITFFSALSSALGYILVTERADLGMILPVFGVFLLACGAAAFNHYQERATDALMNRTQNRPLPANKISGTHAQIFALVCAGLGAALVLLGGNFTAFYLSLTAIVWYNLIYTPLKKVTSLAVIPGAVLGALPPAIGWAAAGGMITDPRLWVVAMFFYIWQIPHFWFLFLLYDEDYKRGGFPTLTSLFSPAQISRISYVWVFALSVSCLMIPYFQVTRHPATGLILFLSGVMLVIRATRLLNKLLATERKSLLKSFMDINVYVLAVTIALTLDSILK